jgi:hypothetical protein
MRLISARTSTPVGCRRGALPWRAALLVDSVGVSLRELCIAVEPQQDVLGDQRAALAGEQVDAGADAGCAVTPIGTFAVVGTAAARANIPT